jgi:hypothetical protein
MNYFAHGRYYTRDPYFMAGTAVPDWLNVVDRRVRARSKGAAKFVDDADPRMAALAKGVMQHHHDDDWFHRTAAFAELSLHFTKLVRSVLADDDGMRPSFLGHILVELLLDAVLIEENPSGLDAYYATLQSLDGPFIEAGVAKIAGREPTGLHLLIPKFCQVRFLWDYQDDEKLLMRLGQVMQRVKLPPLPDILAQTFPEARRMVAQRRDELLAGENPRTIE